MVKLSSRDYIINEDDLRTFTVYIKTLVTFTLLKRNLFVDCKGFDIRNKDLFRIDEISMIIRILNVDLMEHLQRLIVRYSHSVICSIKLQPIKRLFFSKY